MLCAFFKNKKVRDRGIRVHVLVLAAVPVVLKECPHRGDGGALVESTGPEAPNCGLPASPNHPRGFSPRFILPLELRVEVPSQHRPSESCTSGLFKVVTVFLS